MCIRNIKSRCHSGHRSGSLGSFEGWGIRTVFACFPVPRSSSATDGASSTPLVSKRLVPPTCCGPCEGLRIPKAILRGTDCVAFVGTSPCSERGSPHISQCCWTRGIYIGRCSPSNFCLWGKLGLRPEEASIASALMASSALRPSAIARECLRAFGGVQRIRPCDQ